MSENIGYAGLKVGTTQQVYDSKYAEDEVISQAPQGGTNTKTDTKVDLMVSKGVEPKRVKMPNLVGGTLDAAKESLTTLDLEIGSMQEVESTTYSSNYVTSQSVAVDTQVEQGTKINITVSKGPGPADLSEVKTKDVQFTLPDDKTSYEVMVKIQDAKDTRIILRETYPGGKTVILNASYYSPAICEIYLDENLYRTEKL